MKKAQTFLEYAMIMAAVCAALIAMGLYVRRSVQANLKIVEVQVNDEMMGIDPPAAGGGGG